MEDDADSNEEVKGLRAGLVAVKFSKELKQKIRSPWYKALIVKVYERSVWLNFLQNRLLSMWRPAGRLDCVDLRHGFFLTRFSLREDYEATLKMGPWFIGEHFLSIRPWEPDFSPATANVASVAVWIRLNELPIEYYHAEALLQIGKAIGNVLRVDTHTAFESRGRFARLCIQVDVKKPLVMAILIGKREQPVCYEGIHKLCFERGRIGHRKELCLYAIRQPLTLSKEVNQPNGTTKAQACNLHEPVNAKQNVGPSLNMHGSAQEDVPESTYGPWIMVMRKKQGTKQQRGDGTTMNLAHRQPRVGKETRFYMPLGSENLSTGLSRDIKRKLSPQRTIDGLQVAKTVQCLVKEGLKPVNEVNETGPSVLHVKKAHSRPGKEIKAFKPNDRGRPADVAFKPNTPNPLASVKGKKGIARNRAALFIRASADEGDSIVGTPLSLNAQGRNLNDEENGSGRKLSGTHFQFQSPIELKSFVGYQFRGGFGSDQGTCISDHGRG